MIQLIQLRKTTIFLHLTTLIHFSKSQDSEFALFRYLPIYKYLVTHLFLFMASIILRNLLKGKPFSCALYTPKLAFSKTYNLKKKKDVYERRWMNKQMSKWTNEKNRNEEWTRVSLLHMWGWRLNSGLHVQKTMPHPLCHLQVCNFLKHSLLAAWGGQVVAHSVEHIHLHVWGPRFESPLPTCRGEASLVVKRVS